VGSTFTVCLPRADRRIQRTERQAVAPRSEARILVIEDNADVAETMALVLRERGHEIRIAPDGASALAVVREEWLPHILLIDLGLPDIHGHELVKQLRTTEATAGAYMVAVSGYGQSSDIRASLEAGFDKHLVKPVDFDVLNAVLDSDRRRN